MWFFIWADTYILEKKQISKLVLSVYFHVGLPWWHNGNAAHIGSVPGLGRPPWTRKWHPTAGFSCLENSLHRGASWATVHGVTKSQTWLKQLSIHAYTYACPGGSDGTESTCNAEDMGSIPGSGRSPGEGNGYPLQYYHLENSMDRGTDRLQSWDLKELDSAEWLTHTFTFFIWFLWIIVSSYTKES